MIDRYFKRRSNSKRRGVVAVVVMLTLTTLLGMAALAIDVGSMINTRADLQNAADAAAMAGVSSMATDLMVMVKQGTGGDGAITQVISLAKARAAATSVLNASFGARGTITENADIQVGWIDLTSATSTIVTGGAPGDWNAVTVTVRRSHDGQNGPVTLFFASIFGQATTDITASATAALDDRVGTLDPTAGWLWPFSVDQDYHDDQMANGNDVFSYDEGTGSTSNTSDGIREIHMFPYNSTPGNFGLLNIGSDSSSSSELAEQIINGVTTSDWEEETGHTELDFTDDDGNAVAYTVTGNAGLKSSLFSDIEGRIGDVVAYFLHDQASGTGSNTVYRITGVRFGRVMGINVEDSNRKGLWLQPIVYNNTGINLETAAPGTGGMIGRVVLAR